MRYLEAKKTCESYGATLNSIHSSEEKELIVNLTKNIQTSPLCLWIGAQRNGSRNNDFI